MVCLLMPLYDIIVLQLLGNRARGWTTLSKVALDSAAAAREQKLNRRSKIAPQRPSRCIAELPPDTRHFQLLDHNCGTAFRSTYDSLT